MTDSRPVYLRLREQIAAANSFTLKAELGKGEGGDED